MTSSFKGLQINDTGYLQLPNGTTANRPSLSSNSAIQWTNTGSQSYTVLAGSATGTNTSWTCPAGVTFIEVLVVAGGGAGNGGTGGGAGGLIYNPAYPVVAGTSYTVTVGAGGSSSAGSNSIFGSLVAIGGGLGNDPTGGGSGGGGQRSSSSSAAAAKPGTAGQGTYGGNGAPNDSNGGGGGGGGGAGANGFPAPSSLTGGDGGAGISFNISGSTVYYAGGGGGAGSTANGAGGLGGGGAGGSSTSNNATAGTASTGGGGGGWRHPSVNSSGGAAGGSGIVILRYTLADASTQPYGQTRYNTVLGLTETFNHNNVWSSVSKGEKIVANGLIMNLDASRYSTSSTTWYDQTPNGNNGTLTNGPAYTPNHGGGIIFDGSNDYVALPNGLLQGSGDFTVHMWIQPTAATTNTIFAGYPSSNLQVFCNAGNMGIYLGGGSTYYVPSYGEFNLTSPTCITALRRGTRVELYINGVFKKYGAESSSLGSAGTAFRIGTNTSGGEQFTGIVYNCLVYNRALAVSEITQNYQSQSPRFKKGKKQTLAGWRSVGSGVFSNANLVWSSEQGTKTGYSATCWNEAFVGDFTLVAFWRHDYIGMGVQYGSDISVDGFTGYSGDSNGPYGGSSSTSGFASGYQGTYYGQYHAPITGGGGSTPYPGYWFKWARLGNVVTMQYSTVSGYGPWSDNNSANRVVVNSTDKVICVIGEASGTEYYPLTFVSLTYNN